MKNHPRTLCPSTALTVVLLSALLLVLQVGSPATARRAHHKRANNTAVRVVVPLPGLPVWHDALPGVTAPSVILADTRTGKILFQRHCHERREPASLTKILTAILVLEKGDLSDPVVASKSVEKVDPAAIGLKAGNRISLRDLLCAILIKSANDASVAAAEHIANTEKAFVELMNERARELGAKDSHFVNAHGLHHPEQWSTAHDLLLLARHAMTLPLFKELVTTKTMNIGRLGEPYNQHLINKNRLLWRYDQADGVKTGYTKQAGNCLVASATRKGWQLVAVVLHSSNAFNDAAVLLDYGFTQYQSVILAAKGQEVLRVPVRNGSPSIVPAVAADNLTAVVPRGQGRRVHRKSFPSRAWAPLKRGGRLGSVCSLVDGREQSRVPLVAGEPAGLSALALLAFGLKLVVSATVFFVVGAWSYAAFAKTPRLVRHRFPSRRRETDPGGPSDGQRESDHELRLDL